MDKTWTVGILLFNEVEVLDFAGPFEAFSITTLTDSDKQPFSVKTISETGKLVSARNGLKVQPDYSFEDKVHFDIVIVPGGYGAEAIEINNPVVIEWIKEQANKADIVGSVCTGAFLLAQAGLLDYKSATTHWMDLDILQKKFPKVKVQQDVKFIQSGNIYTSAGVSAGINMSLSIISQLLNNDIAKFTAKRMEFDTTL